MAELNCSSSAKSQSTPAIRYKPDTVGSCPLSIFASAWQFDFFMLNLIALSALYTPQGLGSGLFLSNSLTLLVSITAAGSACEIFWAGGVLVGWVAILVLAWGATCGGPPLGPSRFFKEDIFRIVDQAITYDQVLAASWHRLVDRRRVPGHIIQARPRILCGYLHEIPSGVAILSNVDHSRPCIGSTQYRTGRFCEICCFLTGDWPTR